MGASASCSYYGGDTTLLNQFSTGCVFERNERATSAGQTTAVPRPVQGLVTLAVALASTGGPQLTPVEARSSHVFAVDRGSGQLIFDYAAPAAVWTAPAPRPDGGLIVADRLSRVMPLGEG
jgi:hypothetical protein